jgi:nuclear pore complex protein Nup93
LTQRFKNGVVDQGLPLLKLRTTQQYNDTILLRAAAQSEREQRLNEAIKLYNLAGALSTVILCLSHGLRDLIAEPGGGGDDGQTLERTAREIIRHYDRTNRVTGKERDVVIRLLGVREAMNAKERGRLEAALEVGFFAAFVCSCFHYETRQSKPRKSFLSTETPV